MANMEGQSVQLASVEVAPVTDSAAGDSAIVPDGVDIERQFFARMESCATCSYD